jgi:cysteine desulfurase
MSQGEGRTDLDGAIYLDGFATLPLAPEARDAMLEAWKTPGNASSPHEAGERAWHIVETARGEVAALIGACASEIVFTSGATEADNLALLGVARAEPRPGRKRIVVSAVEHKAVLEPAQVLAGEGFDIAVAPVDGHGRLDLEAFGRLVDDRTLLVSVMAVNNETGVVQPVAEAASIARAAGALFHSDAAQAAGKIALDVEALDVDYLSLSAHKCYGPMGVGALYVSAAAPSPRPLQYGGGHQGGQRPGTEPVALVAGFGAAARVAREQLRFSPVTGQWPVVPGSLAISLEGVDAESLCMMLARQVQLSTGSACTSGQLRTSHVLEAMGFSEEKARTVMRAFCHRYVDRDQITMAAEQIVAAAQRSALATGGLRQ